MEKIGISEFRARCLAVLGRVQKTRMPICVTRRGIPIAEVIPPSAVQERAEWIESMKGSVKILGDIISPASSGCEWEAERE